MKVEDMAEAFEFVHSYCEDDEHERTAVFRTRKDIDINTCKEIWDNIVPIGLYGPFEEITKDTEGNEFYGLEFRVNFLIELTRNLEEMCWNEAIITLVFKTLDNHTVNEYYKTIDDRHPILKAIENSNMASEAFQKLKERYDLGTYKQYIGHLRKEEKRKALEELYAADTSLEQLEAIENFSRVILEEKEVIQFYEHFVGDYDKYVELNSPFKNGHEKTIGVKRFDKVKITRMKSALIYLMNTFAGKHIVDTEDSTIVREKTRYFSKWVHSYHEDLHKADFEFLDTLRTKNQGIRF